MKSNHELQELYNNVKRGIDPTCETCLENVGKMSPSHYGSYLCESGSLNSGGTNSHCTCDTCF